MPPRGAPIPTPDHRPDDGVRARDRFAGLLAAIRHVSAGLELDELAERVVESARSLVGARYGALGVVRDGRLVTFVHSGMDEETVARIGRLPEGRGMLGCLITDPKPLRQDDLTTHTAAAGFPAHHPPMRSFLGVPLRAGGAVYGNLYLTEATRAPAFTEEDEFLVTTLADAAGVAVENGFLLERVRRRERWHAAAAELTRRLLGGGADADAALRILLEHVVAAADADSAAVTAVDADDPDTVRMLRVVGRLADWTGHRAPLAGSLTEAALGAGLPVLVEDAAADPRTHAVTDRAPGVGAVLGVPLLGGAPVDAGSARHALVVVRGEDAAPFDDVDREAVEAFAAHAGTAAVLLRSREAPERIRRLEDRERVVARVSEQVVSRAPRIGLALASAASTMTGAAQRHLLAQVDDLDELVRAVRDTLLDGTDAPEA